MKSKREKELEAALNKIALMGHGIKEEAHDWANIGRNAVSIARGAIAGRCERCGKPNDFAPGRGKG